MEENKFLHVRTRERRETGSRKYVPLLLRKDADHYPLFQFSNAFEYCYAVEGSCQIQICDQRVSLAKGEGLFLNADTVFRIELLEDDSCCFLFPLHPHLIANIGPHRYFDTFVRPILQQENLSFISFSREISSGKEILQDIHHMYETFLSHDAEGQELDIYAQAVQLWRKTYLYLQSQEESISTVDGTLNDRLLTVVEYIDSHYCDNITLEDIAQSIHLSSSECSRFFRRGTGEALFRYIIAYRVEQSMKLLCDNDFSIAKIAHKVGFHSQSYFTTRFSEMKGITPQQFRKKVQRENAEE